MRQNGMAIEFIPHPLPHAQTSSFREPIAFRFPYSGQSIIIISGKQGNGEG